MTVETIDRELMDAVLDGAADYIDKHLDGRVRALQARLDALELRAAVPGPRGEQGAPGIDGKDGAPGVDGRDGAAGRDGIDGKDGAPGIDGKDGVPGQDGSQGPAGRDGIDGRDGKDGAPGEHGIDGKDGADGLPGEAGKDGKDGAAGRDGLDGKDGAPGRDGIDGKDGSNGRDGKDGAALLDLKMGFDLETREFILSFVGADGETHERRHFVPLPLHGGVLRSGMTAKHGMMYTWGGSTWQAKRDTTKPPPGDDWVCCVQRGKDGKDAE